MSWVQVFTVFLVSHAVGDYMFQTEWQALNKHGGLTGAPVQRRALVSHVATYTLAYVPALIWLSSSLGLGVLLLALLIAIPHLIQDDGRLLNSLRADGQEGRSEGESRARDLARPVVSPAWPVPHGARRRELREPPARAFDASQRRRIGSGGHYDDSGEAMSQESVEAAAEPKIVSVEDCEPVTYRGGDVRTLLGPEDARGRPQASWAWRRLRRATGSASTTTRYSEEFIYVVSGKIDAQLDGKSNAVSARHGLLIPMNIRHRLVNDGDEDAFLVFHLGPLAPRPDLGHVDTE